MIFVKLKRGQSALEFIFTYGWVMLALAGILAALYFFGIADAQRVMPDRCVFLSGLNCLDVNVLDSDNITYPSTLRFVLRNEFGFDISNITISIEGTCDSVFNTTGEIVKTNLLNKESWTYGFGCPNLTRVDVKETITVWFTNPDTGVAHRKVGYIDMKQ